MQKLDLTAIILTYNEQLHIERCLRSVREYARKVVVVDCFSTDATPETARRMGAEVVSHKWPGNQAEQFNWALDNLDIQTEWTLRLDADEYLLPELVDELREKLPKLPSTVSALSILRMRGFQGKVLHHGIVNDVWLTRIFRTGKARYERRLIDEHLVVLEGETLRMRHRFIDDNRLPIGAFVEKHNEYASREAAMLLDAELHLTDSGRAGLPSGEEVERKRAQKARYAKRPMFWRAFGYFLYRYIIRLGFLDGTEGFLWDFMQGWWYRTLVDAKVREIKKACGTDKEKIRRYLREELRVCLPSPEEPAE